MHNRSGKGHSQRTSWRVTCEHKYWYLRKLEALGGCRCSDGTEESWLLQFCQQQDWGGGYWEEWPVEKSASVICSSRTMPEWRERESKQGLPLQVGAKRVLAMASQGGTACT